MQNRLFKVLLIPVLSAGMLLLPPESEALSLLPHFGSKETVIWSSRHQYVRLVPQGRVDGKAPPPNDQPVHFGVAQLRAALGGIDQVDAKNKVAAHAVARPVFSDSELDELAPALVHGLARAKPDQDVVFVVEGAPSWGKHPQLQAVAGRVFFRGGKLNLIFGDLGRLVGFAALRVQGGYNLTPDIRTHPIRVGVRARPIQHDWVLNLREGMSFHGNSAGVLRDDWLELDVPKVVAGLQAQAPRRTATVQPGRRMMAVALTGESRQLRQQTMALVAQRQEMQLQMAHMQKELSEIQSRKEQEQTAAAAPKGAVARLSMLDKLLRDKLITRREFDAKRKEILSQL